MQEVDGQGVKFKPNKEDKRAMEGIRNRHPYLTSHADVIRYALHTVNSSEEVTEDRAAALQEPIKKLNKKE